LIWDLFNCTSGMAMGREIMDRHMMIIEKAFELLGFHADLSVKDQYVVVMMGYQRLWAGRAVKRNTLVSMQKA